MPGGRDGREPNGAVWVVERAIVLQVLRDDREGRWPRTALAEEISNYGPAVLEEALACMERDGVLHLEGDSVWAARAARRLDELELIGI
jgi:hypothetical protein